jgi:protein-tyrosine kinase
MSKLRKALEKAKEERGEHDRSPLPSVALATPPEQADTERSPRDRFMPFNPVYTTTKVIKCEPDFLKQNRIMPVCTEVGADQVKILRTQILQNLNDQGRNTLLVTSANPAEGKTITAINLAISFSHQTNRTVLLVDADIRKPTVYKYLGLTEGPGLSDYLIGKAEIADILINPGMERIVILPGGRPLTNSAELLGSPRMGSLLKEVKEKYRDRFIIIDAAPVLTSADPLILSDIVDGILIVVEAERTKKEDIKKVFEMMPNKPIIGTVFNKAIDEE